MNRREFALSSVSALLFRLQCPNRLFSQIRFGDAVTPVADGGPVTDGGLAGPAHGPWRRLFLDATIVEEQQGLTRQFYSAEKHADNPILVADRPWEGTSAITGPYVYGTVLKDGDRYRMWYQVLFQGNHVGYAESIDAVHWQKPALDIIQYQGQSTNFVVSEFDAEKSGGRCHNPNVILRPNETNPERRYALYGFDGKAGHPRVAFSADGLNWHYPVESVQQPLFSSSDVVNFGYDPYQDRYYSTWMGSALCPARTRTKAGSLLAASPFVNPRSRSMHAPKRAARSRPRSWIERTRLWLVFRANNAWHSKATQSDIAYNGILVRFPQV